ncbi:glycosyltransferase family 2 protein [Arachidicoccus sp.]|uniref:glycosyltransferase family 2 protein n=1 Tax=Arachidicoccus sp. TaxID=1872624 RepID=UPI003D1A2FED
MKISGFTIVRNAIQYDFPIVESITSILNLVDEFVIALGDSSDETEQLVKSIASDKIKIIHSNWDTSKYNKDGQVYAHQTDVALAACTGDWCFYIQADEVLHEDGIPIIKAACEKYLKEEAVDGFLLNYIWFFGSYDKYIDALHIAYPKEIRIIRNHPDIHSWRDAQSFRWMPNFDYGDYWQEKNTKKLNCIDLNAWLYHYSWSRDPRCLVAKKAEQNHMHWGSDMEVNEAYFDYGNLSLLPDFKGSHPEVMKERIEKMNWSHLLRYTGERPTELTRKFKLKYRILSFFENKVLGGKLLFGFKNFKKVGKFGWNGKL